ncbi:MAG: F0F1 ATP synthase subunit alpha, partial [Oscillospiraceae bacterium]|nr:F0F1 ATP synthase subunit alpha [Oscillospiraceae bacterium]
PVDQVREFEKGLYRYLDTNAHKVLRAIAETKVLDEQTEAGLKTALENYLKEFKAH